MPIYEFFCPDCNTIFCFLSKKVDTETAPRCPRCGREILQRRISAFSVTGNAKERTPDGDLPMDESKMEKAMEMLEKETSGRNDEDPRQAANLMRKLTEMTGMELSGNMQEALHRLEAGEDPEKIEAELGETLEKEEPFKLPETKTKTGYRPPPTRDETLYDM